MNKIIWIYVPGEEEVNGRKKETLELDTPHKHVDIIEKKYVNF